MFESATLKLTGWYLLIIMVISLIFSALVYQSAVSEVMTQLERFGQGIPRLNVIPDQARLERIRNAQASDAAHNILIQLVYINLVVLVGGGVTSYLLARRTLRPIEEAHEAQSRFTSDASHELRTPLAAMKTELEVALRDTSLSRDEMRELLESNLEEVDKLAQLSQTLLALSKLDLGSLKTEGLSLEELTREVIKRYNVPENRVRVTVPKKMPDILGNRASITELITILLDNALKYSPPETQILIKLGQDAKQASFDITNGGAGIDENDLLHVFDRFYRADSSRTGAGKNGFGLGLSLAKKIVELHNGELSASSARGADTTFSVLLPTYREAPAKN